PHAPSDCRLRPEPVNGLLAGDPVHLETTTKCPQYFLSAPAWQRACASNCSSAERNGWLRAVRSSQVLSTLSGSASVQEGRSRNARNGCMALPGNTSRKDSPPGP